MIKKQMFEFPITYTTPMGKIGIGWGVHQTVADECKQAGIKKALITTTGLKGTGIVDEINSILTTQGISTVIFNKITSNPKDHEIMAAYKVLTESGCDGVVSVGGGSSHDCGKGARLVAANDGRDICEFAAVIDPPWTEKMKEFKPVTIPQITVNTTSGTSAESTGALAFTNTKLRAKLPVLIPGMAPVAALVDPLLVRIMPQNFAAWTGFDAFAHGYESYISRIPSQYTKAISYRIIKLVAENLREFTYNRMNHVACENMCWAANMAAAGLHFGGGITIGHGIAHQIGALTNCHHGWANAVVAIPLQRYNEPVCPDQFAEMAGAMGVDTRGMTTIKAADKWFDEVERLLADLNIKTGHLHEQFGLTKENSDHIVRYYSNDWSREGNPRDYNYEECIDLVDSML